MASLAPYSHTCGTIDLACILRAYILKLSLRGVIVPEDIQWLTVEDIYEILNKRVPMDTIRSWIRTKRLRAYKPGRTYLVKREDLDKFLDESSTIGEEGQ